MGHNRWLHAYRTLLRNARRFEIGHAVNGSAAVSQIDGQAYAFGSFIRKNDVVLFSCTRALCNRTALPRGVVCGAPRSGRSRTGKRFFFEKEPRNFSLLKGYGARQRVCDDVKVVASFAWQTCPLNPQHGAQPNPPRALNKNEGQHGDRQNHRHAGERQHKGAGGACGQPGVERGNAQRFVHHID